MIKKIYGKIENFTSAKSIWLSFALFITVFVLVNFVFTSKMSYLTQTFNYSSDKAYNMLTSYGNEGRTRHLLVLISDIFMIISYTIFLTTAITATFKRFLSPKNPILYINLLPLILAMLQSLEIIGVFIMLVSYPTNVSIIAQITNIITMLKITLTYICFVLPIIGLIGMAFKPIFTRLTHN